MVGSGGINSETIRSYIGAMTYDRLIPIEGTSNVRCMGAYLTADGRRVRPARIYRSANLDTLLRTYFNEGGTYLDGTSGHPHKPLPAPIPPAAAGVGQVWVDTQFELMNEKSKPGTATAVDATTFKVVRKVGLTSINMNNPHNMWTDKGQTVTYQTQWFDTKLSLFNRSS